MKRYGAFQKLLATALTLIMVMGMIPSVANAVPAGYAGRTADSSTMNNWYQLFMDPAADDVALTTENAGGVWTDKSVFLPGNIPAELTGATSLENTSLSVTDTGDNFLVALSAIASNKEIAGYSTIPTDTVFVLDLSSSMRSNDDNGGSAIDELVDATNKAITDLLALNKNNRVAVVLYAGNTTGQFNSAAGATQVLLPLDSYSAATAGKYLQSTSSGGNANWAIRVHTGVTNSDNVTMSGNMATNRGTFMQDGIFEAMEVLLDTTDTTVTSGVQVGTTRKPIIVLMTDGEPTLGSNDFDGNFQYAGSQPADLDLGNSVMYDYGNYGHRDTIAFTTMLTAALAKREVAEHYGTDSLFYTLAFGEAVNRLDEALSIMDPQQTSAPLQTMWNQFLAGQQVQVYTYRSGRETKYLYAVNNGAQPLTAEDQYYVNEFFPAETDDDLFAAFQSIVDEIILQSKYYPTFVERDHDHDGYITFTDKIGGYMEITDVKGIVIGSHYFSGATLAKSCEDNSLFDRSGNLTALGRTYVASIQQRLHISQPAVAAALLQSACSKGQIHFNSATDYSNYIGWYSDASGNYLDFWYDGITSAVPQNATHIVRSYALLGETDQAHGISDTDMLYASIRVSQEIDDYDNDGVPHETMLVWQVPASLIPTITYQVKVNVNSTGSIVGVDSVELENSNVSPIRLLYEVALEADIHEWNISQKVSSSYYSSTDNKDAGYVFYTNQWKSGSNTDTTRNTYSHFEPSVQNEWYYYIEDSVIYTNTSGSKYTGSSAPSTSGTYYRAYQVYEKLDNGTYRMHTHYEQISADSLTAAVSRDGSWVIPKGTVYRFWDPFQYEKDENKTGTAAHSLYPTVVHDDSNDHYYSYYVLGNNGKLSVTPATGIKITKAIEEAVDGAPDIFTFTISGGSGTATLIRLDENGDEAKRETLTFTDGKAEFTISDGETLYIIGLDANTAYTISENANEYYTVSSVKVDGVEQSGKTAQITADAQRIHGIDFVNSAKGYGNLFITKEIQSEHAIPSQIQAQSFEVVVNVGAALAGKELTVAISDISDPDSFTSATETVAEDGTISLTIVHGQTYEIIDLPEGTVVTVTEVLTGDQQNYFTATILTRDHTGAVQDSDNTVTITKKSNATAILTNTYAPQSTTVDLNVAGTKTFHIDQPLSEDVEFTFLVQHWNGSGWDNVAQKTASVSYAAGENGVKEFFIDQILGGITYTEATVDTYQVIEQLGSVDGITYDTATHSFTVTVTDENGKLTANVTGHHADSVVRENDGSWTVKPHFTNSYHTAGVTVDVVKAVTDTSANPDTSKAGFIFTAVQADENWNILSGGMSKTEISDGAGEARFTATYTGAGSYYYVITETDSSQPGWSYDSTEYRVKVIISQDESGDLSAAMEITTVSGGSQSTAQYGSSASVTFSNTYDPADDQIVPHVRKELTGRDLADGEFTFYVYADGQTGAPLLTGTNSADGTVTFQGGLSFSKVGSYHFDVVEAAGSLGGVTYDPTIYDMVVEVVDMGGQLSASYYFEDAVTNTVVFHNSYSAQSVEYAFGGTKTLTGRPMTNAEFQFVLTEVVDADASTIQDGGLTLVAENDPDDDNDGTAGFTFASIKYTQPGEYFYLIEEVDGGQTILGVVHDDARYVVKVTVTDDGQGNLVASHSLVSGDSLAFANQYILSPVYTDLFSTKTLTGRVLGNGEFSFLLTQTDSAYAPIAGGYTETVTNDAEGRIQFSQLTFTSAGDYYYVVEEIPGSVQGVTYDSNKYLVHITVTDNLLGELLAQTSITLVQDDMQISVSSIVFRNSFVPENVQLPITIHKTTASDGEALSPAGFIFLLCDSQGNELERVESDEQGNASFLLTFSQDDVGNPIELTVQELNGGNNSITYDSKVYHLTVNVAQDELTGQLSALCLVDGTAADPVELTFHNVYHTPVVPPTGDSFTFLLFGVLMLVSALAVVALIPKKKEI